MENKIINAIAKALSSEFGSKYTVYAEKVKQGAKKPCFFISPESVCEIPFPMGRYFRENIFSVSYSPEGENNNREYGSVLERLYRCLEYISLPDGLTRGSHMSCTADGELLKFTVHYDMFVYKPKEPVSKMERLHYNQK